MPAEADSDAVADFDAQFRRGRQRQELGLFDEAVACYASALAAQPDHAGAHNNLAVALMALGRLGEAIQSFGRAVACQPDYFEAHNNLGVAYKRQGKLQEALDCYSAALRCKPDYAQALFNVGMLYHDHKDYEEAIVWYEASLEVDPSQVEAHQNLATLLEKLGRFENVKAHRDAAYGRRALFVDKAREPRRTVLVLWGAGLGNIPIQFLLPERHVTRIVCIVEYAKPRDLENLPAYDLVFNAIGDPDVMGPAEEGMARFMQTCAKPLVNRHEAVAKTARHLIPALLGSLDDVLVPRTDRIATPQLKDALRALPDERFPVLLRPTSSHGGDHLVKLEYKAGIDDLAPWPVDYYYVTDYVDYASPDGQFRKYRVFFIDVQPYAYHLAISERWLVHHDTAGMQFDEWKRREEAAFLDDPRAAIGAAAWAAVEAIGRALGLDYCGVDFSILPDGRVLVFEANATMLAHPEAADSLYTYKNPHVWKILDAFEAMLEHRAGK